MAGIRREELDALRVMGLNPIQTLVVPRVLAAMVVALMLSSLVVLVGLFGAFMFSVYVQHVTPGAFVAGLTLVTGLSDVLIGLAKATLFGLAAGLIACYKGTSVIAAHSLGQPWLASPGRTCSLRIARTLAMCPPLRGRCRNKSLTTTHRSLSRQGWAFQMPGGRSPSPG